MQPVLVLGTTVGSRAMPEHYAGFLKHAEVIVGGALLLETWGHVNPDARRVDIGGDQGMSVKAAVETIRNAWQKKLRVAVLADGDPLYFGIGATLCREMPKEALCILPGISSLQAACAKLNIAWSDVVSLSLHGRSDWKPLAAAVRTGKTVCILGDAAHGPSEIAAWLLERGADWMKIHVFSGLNTEDSHILSLSLSEAAAGSSTQLPPMPCTLLLEPDGAPRMPLFELDPDLPGKDGNLVTKGPVRAVAIAALGIRPNDTVWDVGAGSGSVALAASSLAWSGWVCAVENKAERAAMIRENRRRHGAVNVDVIEGLAPNGLNGLPDPDAVFVGGGLSDDRKCTGMLDVIGTRLRPGGRIVAACVLLGTLERVRSYAQAAGLHTRIISLQAAVSEPLAEDTHLHAYNPVFLVIIEKPALKA